MLEMRPSCEHCDVDLPNESDKAMICTYECTFCIDCVREVLHNVCPNCGGGFQSRPTRPKDEVLQNPMSTKKVFKPIKAEKFQDLLVKFKDINPRHR